jgi:hypothetical protein
MTSPRKTAANRNNAQYSTGPKSAEGRVRARRNALKTGIYARTFILPSEDRGAYLELRKAIFLEFTPDGPVQEGLAELIIADLWRRNRLVRIENEFIRHTEAARMRKARASAAPKSIETLLAELRGVEDKGRDPSTDTAPSDADGTYPAVSDAAVLSMADVCDGNLLDAFVSPFSHTPIEDIARQRRHSGRELLRNIAALDALQVRRKLASMPLT